MMWPRPRFGGRSSWRRSTSSHCSSRWKWSHKVSEVPFAPETVDTSQRAFRFATDRRHDTVGLEHLLLAITDDREGRQVLAACGVNLELLKKQIEEVLAK